MTYQLPKHSPWWARLLGLEMDWQSRPNHRSRSYHDRSRDTELVVGRLGNRWALEINGMEEYTTMHVAVPFLALHRKIASGRSDVPLGDIMLSWGISIYEGDLVLERGRWSKRFTLNPFRWDGYERARLRADGEWDSTESWTPEGKEVEWYSEEWPYAIAGKPCLRNYGDEPRSMKIDLWDAQATCHIERTIRTRRWLSFWKRVEYWVEFRLDAEVGHGTGSWKGGTMGFSERIWPGDSVEDVVRRAASKGRGR